ncbi:hypothetical protein [Nostoc sp. MG11]|uniref:hypothetical protein n=1 Tax=Nostoc sp. MG11 TaxID=2721166 RepID=UPI001867BF43|nr:hypothetical protein [Nostoc sp. MG11]
MVLRKNVQEESRGASALGRQRRGRVSRLEATVVGFPDLYPCGEASYAQRLP